MQYFINYLKIEIDLDREEIDYKLANRYIAYLNVRNEFHEFYGKFL